MGFNRRNNNAGGKPQGLAGRGGHNPNFRKGSADEGRNVEGKRGGFRDNRGGKPRRLGRPNREQEGNKVGGRKFIKKQHEKPVIKDKDDLDRQMRQYWIKSGSAKGKEEVEKNKNLATQKMNEELDFYWKEAALKKKKAEEQAPPAA